MINSPLVLVISSPDSRLGSGEVNTPQNTLNRIIVDSFVYNSSCVLSLLCIIHTRIVCMMYNCVIN